MYLLPYQPIHPITRWYDAAFTYFAYLLSLALKKNEIFQWNSIHERLQQFVRGGADKEGEDPRLKETASVLFNNRAAAHLGMGKLLELVITSL